MATSVLPTSYAIVLISLAPLLAGCAADPVNPSFPVTSSEARQAISQMREKPVPLARPLVIIGGFADPNVSPPLFSGFFKSISADAKVITVSVGLCTSFEQCRNKVIQAVDAEFPSEDPVFTTEVDVVGASLGGLVARCAAAPGGDAAHPRRLKIARLFSISSPHAGATLASFGITDYHRDMRPGSPFLQRLAAADAAASYELYPYVRLHDELVGEQYAAPPGRNPLWLPNPRLTLSHLGAMMDDRILADIGRRLRGEAPFSHEPAAALPAQE